MGAYGVYVCTPHLHRSLVAIRYSPGSRREMDISVRASSCDLGSLLALWIAVGSDFQSRRINSLHK